MVDWQRVVFAHECEPCLDCGDSWCSHCEKHYFECGCVGPDEEGYEFRDFDGILMARELFEEEHYEN